MNRPSGTWTAVVLAVVTGAMYAPWLAGIRRPVHDTFLGIVQWRPWLGDLLATGDFPWWFPHSRYGFSFSTLHFMSIYLDPIGLLLVTIVPYDTITYGTDLALHGLLGASGAYLLARRFLTTAIAALAMAVSFVGSGVAMTSSIAGSVHPGYMTLPWVFLAIALITQAETIRPMISATGLLALGLAWLVASGYPAIWMTLPVFALPFTLIMAGTSAVRLARVAAACVAAGLLGVAIMAPWITETVATPLFGGAVRNAINPNEGTLPLSGVIGLVLINPEYFPGAEHSYRASVYLGVLPGLALAWRVFGWIPATVRHIRPVAVLIGSVALALSALSSVPSGDNLELLRADASFAWPREALALTGLFALAVATMPSPVMRWTRADLALASTSALVWVCATENPLGNLIRGSVPPFIWSRWSYYYLGVAVLTDVILGWRVIEVVAATAKSRLGRRSWRPVGYALACVSVAIASTLFTPSLVSTDTAGGARIGLVTIVWVTSSGVAFALAGLTYWWFARRGPAFQHALPAIPLVAVPLAIIGLTLFVGLPRNRDEALIHAFLELPPPAQLVVDTVHAGLTLGALALTWRFAPRQHLLQGLAIISIADVILAAPRYLSDTDMVIGGQPGASLSMHRSFDFAGTHRDINVRDTLAGMTTKRPGVEPWPIIMPHVRTLEQSFGVPDLFNRFAHFPSAWTNVSATEVDVVPEAFGWAPRSEVHVRPGTARAPDCPVAPSAMPRPPSAMVVDFRASIVGLRVTSDCTRLLVYSDPWAPGWSAKIDGTPAPVLRVNEAIRGVIVPAGQHDLIWTYRPAYWAITKWISVVGLLVTGSCLAWGLWPQRMSRPPPAR